MIQQILDESMAMDVDHYDSNIHKELKTAGLSDLANLAISVISGGEYKLLQIMREMLLAPNLLVLDEPDVFLDFGNLNSLCQLINGYKGTLLVITHNRYLLNHCFNKIFHLENTWYILDFLPVLHPKQHLCHLPLQRYHFQDSPIDTIHNSNLLKFLPPNNHLK